MKRLSLLVVLLAGGCRESIPQDQQTATDEALAAIHDRLDLMPQVAKSKVYLGMPVTDRERERKVLESVEADARTYGVDPAFARRVFTAQIEAAKLVQERVMRDAPVPDPSPAGLAYHKEQLDQLRVRIDGINRDLLKAMAKWNGQASGRKTYLQRRAGTVLSKFDAVVRETAIQPLLQAD